MGDIGCKLGLGLVHLVSSRQSHYTLLCSANRCIGDIYLARDILLGKDVVIKLESMKGEHLTIEHEFRVYKKLGCGISIPRVHWFGTEAGFNAIVMDSLGQSLKELFTRCHFRFSVKTVLLIACQLVSEVPFGLTGTAMFVYIHSHSGIELGRHDDLESLAYVLIYFLHGSLPWQGLSRDLGGVPVH